MRVEQDTNAAKIDDLSIEEIELYDAALLQGSCWVASGPE